MKVGFISSTGGHWTQLNIVINQYMQNFDKDEVIVITEKNKTNIKNEKYNCKYLLQQDRKNKFFPIIFFINIIKSFYFSIKYRPEYVISTGAGSSLPFLIISKLLGSKIVFIESFAKINSPTYTGRIVYKFADYFFIQWKELIKVYPKAIYKGSLY